MFSHVYYQQMEFSHIWNVSTQERSNMIKDYIIGIYLYLHDAAVMTVCTVAISYK